MKQPFLSPRIALMAGLLLAVPTAWFILVNLLKFEWNSPYLYDAIEPTLNKLGLKESLGWNINLLILFGPVLALLLNLLSVLRIRIQWKGDFFNCQLSIKKSWLNLTIILISASLLMALFAYLVGENCAC